MVQRSVCGISSLGDSPWEWTSVLYLLAYNRDALLMDISTGVRRRFHEGQGSATPNQAVMLTFSCCMML